MLKREHQRDAARGAGRVRAVAGRRLLQLASEIRRRQSCDFTEALAKASRSHPELYDAYRCGAGETVGELRKRHARGERLGHASWSDTLADLAQERAELTGSNFIDALMQVVKERPALGEVYQNEVGRA